MKATVKKFWWGKMTTQRVKLNEYGLVEQSKYYLFGKRGLCFMVVNNAIEVEPHHPTIQERIDLEEITGYEQWRREMKLMRLTDEQFDLLINQR